MTFEEIYNTVRDYFEQKDFKGFGQGVYSYEFDVTGQGEGKFYIEVKDGCFDMQPFDYKNSLCSFTVDSGNLCSLLHRNITPTAAYSTGRLTVRGDVSAAFRLADALGMAL
ncbi:MAG: SCP2 sterol-binding domain-containing protein [Clostridia bacterium]|nr:SCP2 sterol-binding domain-containing protein [Clostridia bacterium]